MPALVLLPTGSHRDIAQKHWGLTDDQIKGMHVHHRIPRSKGGTDAPENLYVCSPSFHANVWHNGYYRIIQNASEVARLGGLARQKAGFTPEGLAKRKARSKEIGIENKEKGLGLFSREPEKVSEDARKAGKLGIRSTLAKNPNHMREIGLKGGAPGKSVIVTHNGVTTLCKSISKAIKTTGVSKNLAYKSLKEFGTYSENSYLFVLQ
jgi:general stress protein YciG